MNIKKLEHYFNEYIKNNKKSVSEDGDTAILYAPEEFNINIKERTLYIKGIGVIPLPAEVKEEIGKPDWVAICVYSNEASVVMGSGNPYVSENIDVLPNDDGIIIAVPHSIQKKFFQNN